MRVVVKIGEPLWRTVGSRSLTLEWENATATVADALARLTAEHPAFGPAFRGDGQRQKVTYQVFVNTRMVKPEAWLEAGLQNGDKLFIFLPAVGG